MTKERKPFPVTPPNYETLLSWWDTWAQVRPELLDFWARGNFTRRLLTRKANRRAGCVVRVHCIDEMDLALRRLALLGIEIDFAWAGPVSPPGLVMAPQHIAYKEPGGGDTQLVAVTNLMMEAASGSGPQRLVLPRYCQIP